MIVILLNFQLFENQFLESAEYGQIQSDLDLKTKNLVLHQPFLKNQLYGCNY